MSVHRRRVLIIDDDEDVRAVLEDGLRGAGYYASVLDDGRGAISAIRAQRPDLVILDVVMPEKDGLTVVTEMRTMDYTVPVLMLTGWPLATLALEGADVVMRKPFEWNDLLATVERLVGPA